MEAIHETDYGRELELSNTACMVFATPLDLQRIWSLIRLYYVVQDNVKFWAVRHREESHEDTSQHISSVPGRKRTRGFQETIADSWQRDNHSVEETSQGI